MLKKLMLCIIGLLILTGCQVDYQLTIDGDTFSEDIDIYVYEGDREKDIYDGEESGDRITELTEADVFTYFEDYSEVYDKKIDYKDEYTLINLKKNYSAEDFKRTRSIRLCFENQKFDITEEYYDIHMSGYFYCLYNNDKLTIKIKSNNKVIDDNAERIDGNSYYWTIDQNNFKDVNIVFKTEKVVDNTFSIILAVVIIIIVILSGFMFFRYFKKKKDNRNNF